MMKSVTVFFLTALYVNKALANDTIKVVTEEWPPFNFTLPNGKVGGISTKIVHTVLQQSDIDYDIEVFPWARAYNMAKSRPNVLIYSILRSKERETSFKWICPLTHSVKLFIFTLASRNDIEISNIMDAQKYLTGVTRGDFPHHYISALGFNESRHFHLSPDDGSNVKKLLKGRIDLVIEAELTMRSILRHKGIKYTIVKPVLNIEATNKAQNCMAFGLKTSDKLVNKIRQALNNYNAKHNQSVPTTSIEQQ